MNITILTDDEVQYLARAFRQAADKTAPWGPCKVRIAQSDQGIMVAVGAGMWTPPMGKQADATGHFPIL
jgi:hypothetical protein